MPRLTISLDDEATQELTNLRVEEWRDVIQRALEVVPVVEAQCFVRLSHSLDELGTHPSQSAVMRQALDLYLALLGEARSSVQLQVGYRALAADTERQELVEVMSKRAPSRWNDEA